MRISITHNSLAKIMLWYTITLLLFNRIIKFTLYTQKYKKPKYYYYGKEQFDYCINEQKIINLKWFFGVGLNCL